MGCIHQQWPADDRRIQVACYSYLSPAIKNELRWPQVSHGCPQMPSSISPIRMYSVTDEVALISAVQS